MNSARQKKDRWAEYARFGATGILNTAVDFLVLNLLILASGPNLSSKALATYKAAAFLAAATNSYLLNKHWVFSRATARKEAAASVFSEGGRFLAVSIAGFFINVAISTAVFHALSLQDPLSEHVSANIGAGVGSLVTLLWNYAGYKAFVFNRPTSLYERQKRSPLRGDTGIQRVQTDTPDA